MLRYRPEIDGLRALAVIPVILFHFNIPGFHGGFVGVDIFFVISGYLITSLIMKELQEGTFSFLHFYERRIRRLVPAAVVVVTISYLLAYQIFLLEEFRSFGKSIVAFTLLHSNIHFFNSSGYFDTSSQLKPILHTWSLSVEEQFYVLFPPLLLLLFSKVRQYLFHLILLLFLLSLVVSIYTVSKHPDFAFYMLPSRAWELLLGAMLAVGIFPVIRRKLLSNAASLTGLAMIIVSMAIYDENTAFPGVAALLPCVGSALIIWANSNRQDVSGKLFSWKPLVFIGVISYPLYLWHWPLFVFYRYVIDRNLYLYEAFGLVLVTFVLSYLTYRFIEQPVRQRRILSARRPIFVSALAVSIAFIFVGRVTDLKRGFPERLPEGARTYAMGALDRDKYAHDCGDVSINRIHKQKLCTIGQHKKAKPDFIIWGDSHANMLIPMIRQIADNRKLFGVFATKSGCYPIFIKEQVDVNKKCVVFNKAVLKIISSQKIQNVVLAGYWWRDLVITAKKDKLMPLNKAENIISTLKALDGHQLFVFTGIPGYKSNIPSELAKAAMYNRERMTIAVTREAFTKHLDTVHNLFKSGDADITFIDVTDTLCEKNNTCALSAKKRSLYYDKHHLSVTGAMKIRPSFEPAFEKIRASKSR